ncbi:MAG TPA: methyltransferase domain-containing protein [Mucilaginibacter sp.]|jgi:hypothetical protein|nr:methyltransferase domain-containing protein [Mucilaginibacter sp.]
MIKKIINGVLAKAGYVIKKLPSDNTNKDDFNRLPGQAQKLGVVKLHFGCGPRILKGWLNFDLAYEPFETYLQYYTDAYYPPEIRGGRNDLFIINILKDGIPLPDGSVDVIFHEDFFEHLTEKQQVIFLAETLRVMKKGAVHRINTPNLKASMRDNSDFSKGKAGVFNSEWDYWHHFNVVSPAILQELAGIVGYSQVMFNFQNKSVAADKLPLEYRPDEKDRPATDSNVFADLVK